MPVTSRKTGAASSRFAIDLRIADPAWRRALPGAAALVRRACLAALRREMPKGSTGLALLLTNDAEMQQLNSDWRGKPKPTNVLSFPAEAAIDPAAPPQYLGDVALGLEICAIEARDQGKALADHVAHLVVHGTLHLLGYDHESKEQAAAMEPLEVEILAGLKIADPYAGIAKGRAKAKAKTKTKTKTKIGTKARAKSPARKQR